MEELLKRRYGWIDCLNRPLVAVPETVAPEMLGRLKTWPQILDLLLPIVCNLPCLSPPWTEWWCLWPAVIWPWILLFLLGPLYGRPELRTVKAASSPLSWSRVSGEMMVRDEKDLPLSQFTLYLLVPLETADAETWFILWSLNIELG